MNKEIYLTDLGTKDYQATWDYQEALLQQTIQRKRLNKNQPTKLPTPNHLLLVQHPHVYTLGKSGDFNNLLINQISLNKINATFVQTNRGGDITYHGPGQLVGYPILDLENFKTDINWYLRSLEEVIIKTIEHFGLEGARSQGETGVWLDVGKPNARKICAMGVRMSRWVSMHGFALNVNPDLSYFNNIIPCGIQNKAVTSLEKELGKKVNLNQVKQLVIDNTEKVFGVKIVQNC